jgi:hypothetical protein
MDIGSGGRVAPAGYVKVTSGQSRVLRDLAVNGSPCPAPAAAIATSLSSNAMVQRPQWRQHVKRRCHNRGHVLRGRNGVIGL